ncbi:hypothetical protein Nepgr_018091 [Nepenthes gracilis]|uniref:DUF7086 domain-containing protein n=1 Tax=Nepenthes gracilis TaxID=150966 RepID=A0AAD3SQN0_NEPGR|nr:hypothetical protein Nepgr_018091 [Nepenthes gracilis]
MKKQQEIDRKRKNGKQDDDGSTVPPPPPPPPESNRDEADDQDNDFLALTLASPSVRPCLSHPNNRPPPPPTILLETPPYPCPQPPSSRPPFLLRPRQPLLPSVHSLSLSDQPPPTRSHFQLSPSNPPSTPPPSPSSDSAPGPLLNPIAGLQQVHPGRMRRSALNVEREGKSEIIPAAYPWATNRRATVHSVEHLLRKGIFSIRGEVRCKKCERNYEMEFDLQEKFKEVASFVAMNRWAMHDRAPNAWTNPRLPSCEFCGQERSAKPVISEKKKTINWLFLLLGQMLGCCSLEQLKYFCKHTNNHRTGAKNRILYYTYLALCQQLDPNGPFQL